MNLGFVVHSYDLAEGTGGYVVELVSRMAETHHITVYARHLRTTLPDGVDVVPVRALSGRAYATVLTFPTAFESVRRRHDLVHAQGWVANHADVVTAHIVLRAWRRAAEAAGVTAPWGERWFGTWVERREAVLLNDAAAVIAPSERARQEIAEHYDRSENVFVVPHGFPPSRDAPSAADARRDLGLPADRFIALYVGDARKGLAQAIEVLAHTREIDLAVVGHSRAKPYREAAVARGVDTRLHWIGPLPDPVVAYAAADVLIHPSIYDSFGLVVAEAMAQGLPVIVSHAAGVAELIEPDRAGIIVDPMRAEATATRLETLAADSAALAKLGAEAQRTAAARTWEHVVEETVSVYERIA